MVCLFLFLFTATITIIFCVVLFGQRIHRALVSSLTLPSWEILPFLSHKSLLIHLSTPLYKKKKLHFQSTSAIK